SPPRQRLRGRAHRRAAPRRRDHRHRGRRHAGAGRRAGTPDARAYRRALRRIGPEPAAEVHSGVSRGDALSEGRRARSPAVPMPGTSVPSRSVGANPTLIRIGIAIALPLVAAGTVLGTFLGKEVIVTAAWIALSVGGILFIRPVVGIAAMTVL